ncbi:hypothetical protein Tco_0204893 [Tanacetum coccineum]
MKMEILLEPTLNKLMVEHAEFDESDTHVLERFDTSDGNPVKEILLKLNLPDHRILKDGGEVLKLKNFKKDATLKLFKSTTQERTMKTVNQGMSVEEIKKVVAQRVANAIEAIAIYETKTNMARKSMSQTKRQEDKVAKKASNRRN